MNKNDKMATNIRLSIGESELIDELQQEFTEIVKYVGELRSPCITQGIDRYLEILDYHCEWKKIGSIRECLIDSDWTHKALKQLIFMLYGVSSYLLGVSRAEREISITTNICNAIWPLFNYYLTEDFLSWRDNK